MIGNRRRRSLTCLFAVVSAAISLSAGTAAAHPMGNFSVSRESELSVDRDAIRLTYRVDIAEIPTFQEMPFVDTDGDKVASEPERAAYAARKSIELQGRLRLTIDGQRVLPSNTHATLNIRPGAADLPTMFLIIDCTFPVTPENELREVTFDDENFNGRAGWKEVIASFGAGVTVGRSNVPRADRTAGLTQYPIDLLSAPPQTTAARFSFQLNAVDASRGVAAPAPLNSSSRDRNVGGWGQGILTNLLAKGEWSAFAATFAMVLAFALGCGHALAPGHGKTVVAAYLVGSRSTPIHACALGAVVTITHTVGVFSLGLAVLFASNYVLPEKLYPWLGVISGMTIVAIGGWQLVRRIAATYDPAGAALGHLHGPGGHTHDLPERITIRGLVALGVSGGLVPCPSALVLLLGAVALHQTLAGIVLVGAFSLGLATILTAVGLLMLYARRLLIGVRFNTRLLRYVPVASSVVITLIGGAIALNALAAGGLLNSSGR